MLKNDGSQISLQMPANSRVDDALLQLGLDGPYEQRRYVQVMETKFGKDGERFLNTVDKWIGAGAPNNGAPKIYRQLSTNPRMAHFVSSHQYTELYRAVATALVSLEPDWTPGVVVDFGCGFGLLTQILARLRPEWNFVGVDRRAIIQTATLLARPPLPSNLRFVDADKVPELNGAQPLVLAVCVLHEMLDTPLIEHDEGNSTSHVQALRKLVGLSGVDGQIVTVNRFPYPDQMVPLLDSAMSSLGMFPIPNGLPSTIQVHSPDMLESLEVRSYGHGLVGCVAASALGGDGVSTGT